MIERQSSTIIAIDERERRAGHFVLFHPERARHAFDEDCLACAEHSAQQNNLAAREVRSNLRAQLECLLRAARLPTACGDECACVRAHGCSPCGSNIEMAAPK